MAYLVLASAAFDLSFLPRRSLDLAHGVSEVSRVLRLEVAVNWSLVLFIS